MLGKFPVAATIPVTDLTRAKNFYVNKLGLTLVKESPAGITLKSGNSEISLYKRGPSKADHTLAHFKVVNLEQVIDGLTAKGVAFEHYDYPTLKTNEKGIATMSDGGKGAWFKDPDGNILGIGEFV